MPSPKRGELVKAAKELNAVLKPDPPIDTKAKADVLSDKLNDAACLLDPTDKVSEETQQTLVDIGAELPKGMLQLPGTETDEDEEAAKKKAAKEAAEKEAAEKKKAAKPKGKDPFEYPGSTTAILMCVVDNPKIEVPELKKAAETLSGKNISDATVSMQRSDTLKTLAYLTKKGMLK